MLNPKRMLWELRWQLTHFCLIGEVFTSCRYACMTVDLIQDVGMYYLFIGVLFYVVGGKYR